MATKQKRDPKAGGTAGDRPPAPKKGEPKKEGSTGTKSGRLKSRSLGDVEPPEVLGGRLLVAAAILGVMLLLTHVAPIGNLLEPEPPPNTNVAAWQIGGTSEVIVTIITADYNLLTCAADQVFDNRHCAYKNETEQWPHENGAPLDDNKATIIQPYRTWADNRLIFMAGLWAEPSLAMRLHREPAEGIPNDKLARFTAQCKVRFIGRLDHPRLKWQSGQNWISEEGAMVAVPESCKLIEEPSEECPSGPVCAAINLFN